MPWMSCFSTSEMNLTFADCELDGNEPYKGCGLRLEVNQVSGGQRGPSIQSDTHVDIEVRRQRYSSCHPPNTMQSSKGRVQGSNRGYSGRSPGCPQYTGTRGSCHSPATGGFRTRRLQVTEEFCRKWFSNPNELVEVTTNDKMWFINRPWQNGVGASHWKSPLGWSLQVALLEPIRR